MQDRFRNKISHKFHTKISHDFSGGAAVVTSCGMVPDSVRDTRSFDFSGLPRHAPETSGKACLLGPFLELVRDAPPALSGGSLVLRRVPGYTPGPKVGKMEALRPLLPILASLAKFHTHTP